jgi:hypothetical protein
MPTEAMSMTSTAGWPGPPGSSRPSPAGASRTALAWAPIVGIEQTIALLHWFRRLRIRWEIRDDIHEAFMTLAAAIICWRHLTRRSFC